MTSALALIFMHPERAIACLVLLAGVAAYVIARQLQSRIAGVILGFAVAQTAALLLGWLHFFGGEARRDWLALGLIIPFLSAVGGVVIARVKPRAAKPT